MRPAWISSASSLGEAKPKKAGTTRSRLVRGPRPSSLRAATKERLEADVVPAAPVARDHSERGEADAPSVGRDPDAVDAGAAHDRDSPPALVAGAKDGERVVADLDVVCPAARRDRCVHRVLLRGEVDPREEELRHLKRARAVETGGGRRLVEQPLQERDRPVEPEVVRRGQRTARVRESAPSSRTSARSVFELPPSTARTTRSLIALPPCDGSSSRSAPRSSR